jgi:hypothetical protein
MGYSPRSQTSCHGRYFLPDVCGETKAENIYVIRAALRAQKKLDPRTLSLGMAHVLESRAEKNDTDGGAPRASTTT